MHKVRPDRFLEDVFSLQLNFPFATLAKRLDDDKGRVKAYLQCRKPIPQSFIDRFYYVFRDDLENRKKKPTQREPIQMEPLPSNNVVISREYLLKQEAILLNILKIANDTNRRLINNTRLLDEFLRRVRRWLPGNKH